MRPTTTLGVVGIALAATLTGIAPGLVTPVLAKDSVLIAVPAFLSGPAAGPFGVPARNGAEMVVDAINEGALPAPYDSKGFAGAAVQADYVDENGGNTKQVTEYRNLVQKRNFEDQKSDVEGKEGAERV